MTAQRDLAGHRILCRRLTFSESGNQRRGQGNAGRRTVFGHCALRHVNVNIKVLEIFRGQIKLMRASAQIAQRDMRRFLQDIAQLPGQHQVAFARRQRDLDRLDFAAIGRPDQAAGNADRVLAVDFGGQDLRRAQIAFRNRRGNALRNLALGRHLARYFAADASDLALQVANAAFVGVVPDDILQRALGELDAGFGDAVGFDLLGNEEAPRDLNLLFFRIALELDDFQAVFQGFRYRIQVVGGGDEGHFGQVVRHFQVVVDEVSILLRIQHFQHG